MHILMRATPTLTEKLAQHCTVASGWEVMMTSEICAGIELTGISFTSA